MYSLISAMAKPLNTNGRWINLDIGNIHIEDLFSTYSEIIAVLSNPFLTENIAVNLNTIREEFGGLSISFNDFLIQNGNNTLVPLDKIPTIKQTFVKYSDAFKSGYKVAPINSRSPEDTQLPLAEKKWLHLTKLGIDYELFYKNCLVNVNGFFHLTDFDINGIYVKDGMLSNFMSNENNIGIYSFREVGELTFISITRDMVYSQNGEALKDSAYIDLGIDLSNKTVMLVLGGYFHILDKKTFLRISDSRFKINTSNLPLLDRYYESKNYIDLSSLNLSKTVRNLDQVAISEIFSDDAITAYLTLSQSFFVIMDNTEIYVNKIPVRLTPFPNMFIGYTKPNKPLVVGLGKMANYWSTYEDGQWSITCVDTLRSNYIYDTVDVAKETSVGKARTPNNTEDISHAYMLEIGCDIR